MGRGGGGEEEGFLPSDLSFFFSRNSLFLFLTGIRVFVFSTLIYQSPYRLDSACCNGVAARYWFEFNSRLESMLEEDTKLREPMESTREDWSSSFRASLCL